MRSVPNSPFVLCTILLFTVANFALVYFSYISDKHGDLFTSVDKLMRKHPDSALVILGEMEHVDNLSLREKARYSLLFTKAWDASGMRHSSDSLITIATDFYETTQSLYLPAEAWFYRGRIYENLGQSHQALACYLKVLKYEKGNWDYAFWIRFYDQLASLYAGQGLYGKAASFQEKASDKFRYVKDTTGLTRISDRINKYKMLRDSTGADTGKESFYQIASYYDSREIREDLLQKEQALLQRDYERYLYAGFCCIVLLSGWILFLQWRRIKEKTSQREEVLRHTLVKQQQQLKEQKEENERQIILLEEQISKITAEKDQNLRLVSLQLEKQRLEVCNRSIDNEESRHILSVMILKKSNIYLKCHDRTQIKVFSEDWECLETSLNTTYDNFTLRLKKLYPSMSDTELKACMLTKIDIPANHITRLLKYNSSVLRPRLFKKIFGKEGSTDSFVDFITTF